MKLLITTIAAVVLVGCGPSVPDISIHDAAEEGDIEAVKQHLAAGADVDAKNKHGGTPLHYTAIKEIAELLILNGAEVNAKDGNGWVPLHYAVGRDHRDVAETLIAKGADVNAKGTDGKASLDLADGELADLLRKHGGKTGEELKAEGK
jgi:ankyrin repeat protein